MEAAAAAAKSLQSCPTLCNPIDGSPPGSPVPGILQARTLEWVPISFSNAWKWKVKVKSLSRLWLLANYFKILWGFLPYIDMNLATGARVSPHSEPPSTSLPTPSIWVVPEHQLWVPCFVHQTWTGHLFYMVIYMLQCYSLKSGSLSLSCIYGHHYHLSKSRIYALI